MAEIRVYTAYHEPEILSLYKSVGWSAYTANPDILRRGFLNSLLVLGAYDGEQLVGIIRCVGDGETIVFVQDLLVLPEYQRTGIGTKLLQAVLGRYAHVRQIELTADQTPETEAFYHSNGFGEMADFGCRSFMRLPKR